jgi:EAL domain-containing protein (putative c-di-GMP-specific phosphodiesterase class I)
LAAAYLPEFPDHKLQVRPLIKTVAENPDDAAITAAIISLGKKIVAEGVENEAQMSFLRAHECVEIQGYYFGATNTLVEVTDKLNQLGARTIRALEDAPGCM